jgi:phosphotransferase system enzyme I (PtsI)
MILEKSVEGSKTSHVSILARARGIPLIVGLNAELEQFSNDTPAVLDAEKGELMLNPEKITANKIENRMNQGIEDKKLEDAALTKPAEMKAGEQVKCMLNVDDPDFLETLNVSHCDGIGLTRSEFLFHKGQLPSEDEQYSVYSKIVKWAQGRPVTIRTLDAGGDKPIAGVTFDNETNPFLGVRGYAFLYLTHLRSFYCQLSNISIS